MTTLATDVLQLTASDLYKRLNPQADPEGWTYGPNLPTTEEDVLDVLMEKEDTILNMLTEQYRRLCRTLNYHGEVVVAYATAGQTTAKLGLTPIVSGTLKVYINYPKDANWLSPQRESFKALASEFSYNEQTNVLTFTKPLNEGDWVYVSYDHTAGRKLRMLRRLALNLAVCQIAGDNHMDTENSQWYENMDSNVYSTFKKMRERGDARVAIDQFDKLNLVLKTRSSSSTFTYGFGY